MNRTSVPATWRCILTVAQRSALRGRLLMETCLGEADLRLELRADFSTVIVQLLLGEQLLRSTGHWVAVRIHAEARTVWRGPSADASADEVADFLGDLLTAPEDVLVHRFHCLG